MFDNVINEIALNPWKGFYLIFLFAALGYCIGSLVQVIKQEKEFKRIHERYKEMHARTLEGSCRTIEALQKICGELAEENKQLKEELQRRG